MEDLFDKGLFTPYSEIYGRNFDGETNCSIWLQLAMKNQGSGSSNKVNTEMFEAVMDHIKDSHMSEDSKSKQFESILFQGTYGF